MFGFKKGLTSLIVIMVMLPPVTFAATSTESLSPSGFQVRYPTKYQWTADPTATWYAVVVRASDGSFPLYEGISPEAAGCALPDTTCSLQTTINIPEGAADWGVRVWNDDGPEEWSTGSSMIIGPQSDAVPQAPVGALDQLPMEFTWFPDTNATWYAVAVRNSNGDFPVYEGFSPEELGCADGLSLCRAVFAPEFVMNGQKTWWVRSWVPRQSGEMEQRRQF